MIKYSLIYNMVYSYPIPDTRTSFRFAKISPRACSSITWYGAPCPNASWSVQSLRVTRAFELFSHTTVEIHYALLTYLRYSLVSEFLPHFPSNQFTICTSYYWLPVLSVLSPVVDILNIYADDYHLAYALNRRVTIQWNSASIVACTWIRWSLTYIQPFLVIYPSARENLS